MSIFNSYVSLLEGNLSLFRGDFAWKTQYLLGDFKPKAMVVEKKKSASWQFFMICQYR